MRSTEDAISPALHSSLECLDNQNTYIRLLFIDYSSTFNTIISYRLISKLRDIGFGSALCNWILSFLTHRPQSVRIELIDFRKEGGEHASIDINVTGVDRVNSIKFLRVTITDDLSWTSHIDMTIKKTQQGLFFLMWLRKFSMSIRTLTNFYRCTIKRILSRCIMGWYGNCSAQGYKKLHKVVCTARTITDAKLLSMDSIYTARCSGKAANIIKDTSHP
eukprot:g34835.t1